MITINNIYNLDNLIGMKEIKNETIDLIFTSPPYYNAKEYSQYKSYGDYLIYLNDVIHEVYRILNNDGFFILNTSPVIIPRISRNHESIRLPIPFDTFNLCIENGFKYIDDIIWKKPDGASNRAIKFSHHRRPMAYKPFTVTEYLFVYRKINAPLIDKGIRKHSLQQINQSLINDEYERTNIWEISPSHNKNHPAIFPEKLAKNIISYYSYVNDLVLDPFMGSGTVAKAAKELKRNYVGFELNKEYCDYANKNVKGEL